MAEPYPFDLVEDLKQLAGYQGWTEEVYRDFQACRQGEMTEAQFKDKYAVTTAILIYLFRSIGIREVLAQISVTSALVLLPVVLAYGMGNKA